VVRARRRSGSIEIENTSDVIAEIVATGTDTIDIEETEAWSIDTEIEAAAGVESTGTETEAEAGSAVAVIVESIDRKIERIDTGAVGIPRSMIVETTNDTITTEQTTTRTNESEEMSQKTVS